MKGSWLLLGGLTVVVCLGWAFSYAACPHTPSGLTVVSDEEAAHITAGIVGSHYSSARCNQVWPDNCPTSTVQGYWATGQGSDIGKGKNNCAAACGDLNAGYYTPDQS